MRPASAYGKDKKWQALPLPHEIVAALPDAKGETEQCWHYLTGEFVRDIQGETVESYPTFKEASLCQKIINLIRQNDNWPDVSHLT